MTNCIIVKHLGPERASTLPVRKSLPSQLPSNALGAVITGASSGLGRELAIRFSAGGYHVILSGRNKDELQRTHELCIAATPSGEKFPGSTIICGDLRDSEVIKQIALMAGLYRANYLVTCAAVYSKSSVDSTAPCDILLPNLVATIELVKAIYPVFLTGHCGTFVNINSTAGKHSSENESLYVASKHGLTGFFGSLRLEARRKNIRVMDVFIGGMKTPMMKHRPDYDYLIDPVQAAAAIHRTAVDTSDTFQVDELTLGRFSFP